MVRVLALLALLLVVVTGEEDGADWVSGKRSYLRGDILTVDDADDCLSGFCDENPSVSAGPALQQMSGDAQPHAWLHEQHHPPRATDPGRGSGYASRSDELEVR
jgi:hypothetical protein